MSDDINIPDEWQTSSGLSLAGAEVEIIGAVFGFNQNIGADTICLNFTFQPLEGGDPIEQSFSVGNGWEIAEKGDLLAAADGRARSINRSTNLGRLIDSILGVGDFAKRGPAFKGEGAPFGSPKRASEWIGTKWLVDTIPVETRNPKTQEVKTKDAYVFVDFLGSGSGAGGSVKAAGAKATGGKADKAAGKATAKAADEDTYGIEDAELRAELLELAKGSDSHDEFVEAAYKVDGVDGDQAVEGAILKKRAGSLWAAAQA